MSLTNKEDTIYKKIKVASENNPEKPEFPSDDPKFPATPTYKIKIPGYNNVYLKDESYNPTGTHKDRMAWEIIVTYKSFLKSKKDGLIEKLPVMSIISSGSAAYAIQSQLRKYGLPNLKVIVDEKISPEIITSLEKMGCTIYKKNLSLKKLSGEDILKITDNQEGFDITSNEALDPTSRFYDWLSYEIINNSPDYCFIPFGTGNLFENILNITKKEVSTKNHDPRFKGNVKILKRCDFFGATTNNKTTKADKLYSPHLPFVHYSEQWLKTYKFSGFVGHYSDVLIFKERYLKEACEILESQGVSFEPSAAAGLALFLEIKNKIPKTKKILIVSTGKSKYL
ncbi:PLP-dependent lyase/thiolase [archaeon]|nr:PLP-dependent lyase/thiolase [archaeon]NCP79751.1 PLP-dependent lyase/thiolase [archaeon]NCP98384.1 PLP-dependent lyase/thiolase [archaeon]NCQ07517.1 PLP-dependent lyase/thiolase [archaeon]NCQ51307.1 PLP-dependent lyase/thiolase [archaeon]